MSPSANPAAPPPTPREKQQQQQPPLALLLQRRHAIRANMQAQYRRKRDYMQQRWEEQGPGGFAVAAAAVLGWGMWLWERRRGRKQPQGYAHSTCPKPSLGRCSPASHRLLVLYDDNLSSYEGLLPSAPSGFDLTTEYSTRHQLLQERLDGLREELQGTVLANEDVDSPAANPSLLLVREEVQLMDLASELEALRAQLNQDVLKSAITTRSAAGSPRRSARNSRRPGQVAWAAGLGIGVGESSAVIEVAEASMAASSAPAEPAASMADAVLDTPASSSMNLLSPTAAESLPAGEQLVDRQAAPYGTSCQAIAAFLQKLDSVGSPSSLAESPASTSRSFVPASQMEPVAVEAARSDGDAKAEAGIDSSSSSQLHAMSAFQQKLTPLLVRPGTTNRVSSGAWSPPLHASLKDPAGQQLQPEHTSWLLDADMAAAVEEAAAATPGGVHAGAASELLELVPEAAESPSLLPAPGSSLTKRALTASMEELRQSAPAGMPWQRSSSAPNGGGASLEAATPLSLGRMLRESATGSSSLGANHLSRSLASFLEQQQLVASARKATAPGSTGAAGPSGKPVSRIALSEQQGPLATGRPASARELSTPSNSGAPVHRLQLPRPPTASGRLSGGPADFRIPAFLPKDLSRGSRSVGNTPRQGWSKPATVPGDEPLATSRIPKPRGLSSSSPAGTPSRIPRTIASSEAPDSKLAC